MMPLDSDTALLLTHRVLGMGLVIQSAELFVTRQIFAPGGALAGRSVTWLLLLRGLLACWLVMTPNPPTSINSAALLLGLLGSSVWLTVRARGPLCGGSDSMFFQVQLGLGIAAFGFIDPVLIRIGLGWIAAQSILSYFLAGVAKLQHGGWRNGRALQNLFAARGPYVLLTGTRAVAQSQPLCALLGWGILLFELGFPGLLILPLEGKLVWLGLGLAFHVANAALLGLNRFIWAWAATYPALLHFQ